MKIIEVNNVCQALDRGVALLLEHGREEPSRAGPVLVAPWPVTTVYHRPRERVLFSPLRDANPFFHLAESMWMLAGRRDAAFLNNFVGDFGERFAEPDGSIHDAYGHRWRHAFDYDQLDAVVGQLGNDPASRQAVVTMWDAGHEGEASNDLLGKWRTRPCNTHAYLRIRDDTYRNPPVTDQNSVVHEERISRGDNLLLDLTVLCRSNDIWWGAYGANAVHFSVLQEYLAARLDVGVGTMYQVSNNYHVYRSQMDQLEQRRDRLWPHTLLDDRYFVDLQPSPLVHDAESFDEEVRDIIYYCDNPTSECLPVENFNNKFLSLTVWPMLLAHHHWRQKNYEEAASWLEQIDAPDWRAAATEWVARRKR